MLVLWSICLGAFTCNHHITRFSILGQWDEEVTSDSLCVALVSFNLQGIPRRPVMNPFRPDPDEMALDSLFQTPSTFASSNPSAQPVVPRPKRQTYADLTFFSRLVTSLICRSVSGVLACCVSRDHVLWESRTGGQRLLELLGLLGVLQGQRVQVLGASDLELDQRGLLVLLDPGGWRNSRVVRQIFVLSCSRLRRRLRSEHTGGILSPADLDELQLPFVSGNQTHKIRYGLPISTFLMSLISWAILSDFFDSEFWEGCPGLSVVVAIEVEVSWGGIFQNVCGKGGQGSWRAKSTGEGGGRPLCRGT